MPLTLLDDPAAGPRIRAAVADRAVAADARTVNRELSALRGAVAWWQDQDWIRADPTAGRRHLARPAPAQAPVTREQAGLLFRRVTCLRDHALWRVLYDSGAPAGAGWILHQLRGRPAAGDGAEDDG